MNSKIENTFGNTFERILIAILAITTGLVLIYLALAGPLYLHHLRYKTAEVINNQLVGQDIVNLFLLSPILIIAGITLLLKKNIARYLLILSPLYLFYGGICWYSFHLRCLSLADLFMFCAIIKQNNSREDFNEFQTHP